MLQLIFENLHFTELFRIADSHPALVQPVQSAFRHIYADNLVKINGPLYPVLGETQRPEEEAVERNGMIDIRDYNLTLKFLSTFGSAINKLHVNYKLLSFFEITHINELVRENSAKRVKHFGIAFDGSHPELVPPQLSNAESVDLDEGDFGDIIDLNDTCPNMKGLVIGTDVTASSDLIDRHFPLLAHLEVHFKSGDIFNETQIENVLKKNPQIKSIATGKYRRNDMNVLRHLKVIGENLLNLETLEIKELVWYFTSDPPSVFRFETVKQFIFHVYWYSEVPRDFPIEFGDQLEDVKMVSRCFPAIPRYLLSFFAKNTNIQKVSFDFPYGDCKYFAQLLDVEIQNTRELVFKGVDLNVISETDDFLSKVNKCASLETIHFVELKERQVEILEGKFTEGCSTAEFQNEHDDYVFDVILTKA